MANNELALDAISDLWRSFIYSFMHVSSQTVIEWLLSAKHCSVQGKENRVPAFKEL
jgi:hypothetical protein